MRQFFLLLALLVLLPAGVAAQTCIGRPVLDENSSGNVGFDASFFEDGRVVGADAAYGGPAFMTGSFRYTDYDNTELSLKAVGVGAGYDFDGGEGVRICPVLNAQYGFGLELLAGDYSVLQVAPGLAMGMLTPLSSTVDILPFAQAAFVYSRSLEENEDNSVSRNDSSGLFSFGARALFNQRLSLGPTLLVPVGQPNGDVLFGFTMTVGVGGG